MRARRSGGRRVRMGAAALAFGLLLGNGRAEAADAAALEAQLHDWLAALLGPRAGIGQRPVQVTPQDDHFALAIPLAGPVGQTGITIEGTPLTATARSLQGGRWALDDIRVPSPLRITAPTPDGDSITTVTMQAQDQHAVIDPSLATASTYDGQIGGYASRWQGPGGERHSEAAHIRTHLVWQPAGDGRVDVAETVNSDLLSGGARMDQVGLVSFSAAHAQVTAHLDRLAPAQVPPLLHAAFDVAPLLSAAGAMAEGTHPFRHLTPEQHAALAAAVDAAGSLLRGFDERATLQNVRVQGHGVDATMRRLQLGTSAAAPDGRLRLRLHLAMDGFDSSALPDGPLRRYLPRHIALTPRLSGLRTDRVLALLHQAVANNGDDPELAAEAGALVREGPLAVGLDELAADFGPATLAGSGELRVAGPEQVSGTARIRMTGLDALIHDAQTVPMLRQALPMLIFLKGIGEADGTAMVWNVVYADGRVTVNGTDLSQMMPGK